MKEEIVSNIGQNEQNQGNVLMHESQTKHAIALSKIVTYWKTKYHKMMRARSKEEKKLICREVTHNLSVQNLS
jgi:hypothetical protein